MSTTELLNSFEIKDRNVKDVCFFKKCEYDVHDNELVIYFTDGSYLEFSHKQSCCEEVFLYDTERDLKELIGSEIFSIEETCNESQSSFENDDAPDEARDNFTWTFYRIKSSKGYFTLRWLGTSNGNYSESVDVDYCTESE